MSQLSVLTRKAERGEGAKGKGAKRPPLL